MDIGEIVLIIGKLAVSRNLTERMVKLDQIEDNLSDQRQIVNRVTLTTSGAVLIEDDI